ncbi:hypothetical protein NC661_06845 [Aquibacillus koreensis]|uniref:Uncharacterized protein n=1 Tax=Aquibacillus koreensis TaxID=279446 RepID=A0A9X4AHV2_9BACI|nr:hypothetical protein [Aquibacillus koreensis]MCT2535631.1 hypothetical protein [Aquibacillus koreensis]MDC3420084.1 hypothetical protein [Aquibacillus koreensis]
MVWWQILLIIVVLTVVIESVVQFSTRKMDKKKKGKIGSIVWLSVAGLFLLVWLFVRMT